MWLRSVGRPQADRCHRANPYYIFVPNLEGSDKQWNIFFRGNVSCSIADSGCTLAHKADR